jgi:hypothetical protein
MTDHGEITSRLGRQLQQEPSMQKYSVYYDHGKRGDKNVCEISSVLGNQLRRDSKIAEIDIAILDQREKVILLIEIEESDDNPKKLIGDAITTLIGDKIFINRREVNQISEWTTLIVYAKKNGEGHEKRTKDIEIRINQLITNEKLNKMKINNIKLELFQDPDKLQRMIIDLLMSHPQVD